MLRLVGAKGRLAVASLEVVVPKLVSYEWIDFFSVVSDRLSRVHSERIDGMRDFGFIPGRESFAYLRGEKEFIIVSLEEPSKRWVVSVANEGPIGCGVLGNVPYVCVGGKAELLIDSGTEPMRLPVKGAQQIVSYSGARDVLFLIRTKESMVAINIADQGEVQLLTAESLPGRPALESIERVGASLFALTTSQQGLGFWRIRLPEK